MMMKIKKILFFLAIFLIPIVYAETTFFDQDDAFVLGHSTITPTTDGGLIGGGGCRYEWNCTNWSECLPSGKQIRTCTNIGTCSSTYKSPELNQNCTYTAPKVEENKKLEKENTIEKEEEKQQETEKISRKEIVNKNKVLIYFITALIIGFVILYQKKDYLKKLIKKIK